MICFYFQLMKPTTEFLTGIQLLSDTFYAGVLMLHHIQSAVDYDFICPSSSIVIMKVVSFKEKKPKGEARSTALVVQDGKMVISATVTFVLTY